MGPEPIKMERNVEWPKVDRQAECDCGRRQWPPVAIYIFVGLATALVASIIVDLMHAYGVI